MSGSDDARLSPGDLRQQFLSLLLAAFIIAFHIIAIRAALSPAQLSIRATWRRSRMRGFDKIGPRRTCGIFVHPVCYSDPSAEQSIAMSVSVCLSVIISHKPDVQTSPDFRLVACGSVLLRRRCNTLCSSGFLDDIVSIS